MNSHNPVSVAWISEAKSGGDLARLTKRTMRYLLFALGVILAHQIAQAKASECERVRGGLSVCTESIGKTFHIVTSRAGRVIRYEAVIPNDLKGVDLQWP